MRREAPDFKMRMPHARKVERARPQRGSDGDNEDLLALLREVRRQMADEHEVPAYVVASNRTLDDIVALMPRSRSELLKVHGMGKVRSRRYGKPFLAVIEEWEKT